MTQPPQPPGWSGQTDGALPPGTFGPPPGWPGQPPGWTGQPYGMPPKRRRVWPWVVGGVLLLVFGLIGTCVAAVTVSLKAPIDAANEFAAMVIAGDLRAAYDSTCPTAKGELGYESFLQSVGSLKVTAVDLNSSSMTTGDESRAVVEGTMTSDGAQVPVRIDLVKSGRRWQVCGFHRADRFPSDAAPEI